MLAQRITTSLNTFCGKVCLNITICFTEVHSSPAENVSLKLVEQYAGKKKVELWRRPDVAVHVIGTQQSNHS